MTKPETPTDPPAQPTTVPPSSDPVAWGDANVDGKVDLNDAVSILQFVALPAKYGLTAMGEINADCVDNGESGVNGSDALAVQMVDAKLLSVDELPISSTDLTAKQK